MKTMLQPGAVEPRDTFDIDREQELEREHREAIEKLAHELWINRGCPANSAEADWLEAEKKLAPRLVPAARN